MYRSLTPADASPLPLLITGVTGVPGYNALPYFRARYPGRVVGIRQSDNWRLTGPDIVACDAEDYDGLSQLFDTHQFAAVLKLRGKLCPTSLRARSRVGSANQC